MKKYLKISLFSAIFAFSGMAFGQQSVMSPEGILNRPVIEMMNQTPPLGKEVLGIYYKGEFGAVALNISPPKIHIKQIGKNGVIISEGVVTSSIAEEIISIVKDNPSFFVPPSRPDVEQFSRMADGSVLGFKLNESSVIISSPVQFFKLAKNGKIVITKNLEPHIHCAFLLSSLVVPFALENFDASENIKFMDLSYADFLLSL